MNLSLYIARKYLFARKKFNAINIVSLISALAVAVGSMALIIVLSVFNGFDGLIKKLYNVFDPELLITAKEGKTFIADSVFISKIKEENDILFIASCIEENALLRYGEKQYIARIKGVSDEYQKVTGVDSMIIEGEFKLKKNNISYAVIGNGVSYYLGVRLNLVNPIVLYVPRRLASNPLIDPSAAFKSNYIFPSGIFSIQSDFDNRYIIVPIEFTRNLLEYQNNEVTSLELKLKNKSNIKLIKEKLKTKLGDAYYVKDQYEQNEFFYKIMKSEKWAIYFILSFILIIASFNMIGSITLLIIEKKKDIGILQSLGATMKNIRKIFLFEGWLISILGAIFGIIVGLIISWMQQTYGLLKLKGSGSFIIDAYPVEIRFFDTIIVFIIVLTIGFIASYIPSRYITDKFVIKPEE
jgi:lipoprotein-releasing system permease protein